MDNSVLQRLLEEGTIDQQTFDKYANSNKLNDQDASEAKQDSTNDQDSTDGFKLSEDELNRRIQSAVDRATCKLGNEKKKLEEQISELKKKQMTEAERQAFDLSEREKALAEKEAKITEQENRLYAIKALKKAGLDDGTDASLELTEFVLGKDAEAIDAKVKAFQALLNKMVSAEVSKTFKTNGGNPAKGSATPGVENPYKKETFNFTKQLELESTQPELAKQLRAQAGL